MTNNQLNYSGSLSPFAFEAFSPFSTLPPFLVLIKQTYLATLRMKSDNGLVSKVLWETRTPTSFPRIGD